MEAATSNFTSAPEVRGKTFSTPFSLVFFPGKSWNEFAYKSGILKKKSFLNIFLFLVLDSEGEWNDIHNYAS